MQLGVFITEVPLITPVLDYFLPLNESREKMFIVPAEYPFDPYQYFYELWMFYNIAILAEICVTISNDSTFIALLHHNLGLFAVTKYVADSAKILPL